MLHPLCLWIDGTPMPPSKSTEKAQWHNGAVKARARKPSFGARLSYPVFSVCSVRVAGPRQFLAYLI